MRKFRRTKPFLLCFVLICGFSKVFSQNVTEKQIKESVMETIFDIFYKIMEMSENFERFPLNETYVDSQYHPLVGKSRKYLKSRPSCCCFFFFFSK